MHNAESLSARELICRAFERDDRTASPLNRSSASHHETSLHAFLLCSGTQTHSFRVHATLAYSARDARTFPVNAALTQRADRTKNICVKCTSPTGDETLYSYNYRSRNVSSQIPRSVMWSPFHNYEERSGKYSVAKRSLFLAQINGLMNSID